MGWNLRECHFRRCLLPLEGLGQGGTVLLTSTKTKQGMMEKLLFS